MANKPAIPNYLPIFINTLNEHGASAERIEAFQQYWAAHPSDAPNVPCPHCYVAGKVGSLIPVNRKDDNESFRCNQCGAEIVVNEDAMRHALEAKERTNG